MNNRYPLVALALCSSCGSGAPPERREPDSLVFEMRSAERSLDDCIAGAPDCSYVRFDHPNVVDKPEALSAGAQAVTDAVQDFLAQPFRPDGEPATPREIFDRFMGELASFEGPAPWFLERKVFVVHNTARIVSLSFAERSYLGGAHPLETFHFRNFDVTTGKELHLTDVVREAKQEELRMVAEQRFRRVRRLEPDSDLAKDGFEFEHNRFALTDNFAIEDEGLAFYYNPYDIAAYVYGPTELKLGYDELGDILTPLVKDNR